MLYLLLYYAYYLGDYTILSPLWYTFKYSWMLYNWNRPQRTTKTVIINQEYDSEEGYVNLEMTEMKN
jgi:hypothetical protein